jgi:hypothetical protein
MTWREAFISQARHDFATYLGLTRRNACMADRLHFLQMATEKLARGYLAAPASPAPPTLTHTGIVRMFQHLKSDLALRQRLGYTHARSFSRYLDSLLGIAGQIQSLAPAIAGTTQPNPEYPWRDAGLNSIVIPWKHDFRSFVDFENANAAKFLKLIAQLFELVA